MNSLTSAELRAEIAPQILKPEPQIDQRYCNVQYNVHIRDGMKAPDIIIKIIRHEAYGYPGL